MTTLREGARVGASRARARNAPARRGGTDTPDAPAEGAPPRPFALRDHLVRVRDADPWRGRPWSLQEVWEHTCRGGWVPGDWPWWVEVPGYVYGAVVLAMTVAAYGVLWILHRPWAHAAVWLLVGALWWAN